MELPMTAMQGKPEAAHADGWLTAARMLVLDRSRLFADVLGRRLLTENDVAAVSVASSGAEALRLLAEESHHAVVAAADLAIELDIAPTDRAPTGRLVPIVILAETTDTARVRELFLIPGVRERVPPRAPGIFQCARPRCSAVVSPAGSVATAPVRS